jgi:hypothetical protein
MSTSGPSAPTLVPSFHMSSATGPVYSLSTSSNLSASHFVNITSLTLMLIGSREAPMSVSTSASGTAPLTLVSNGTALVQVNFTDNRRLIRTNALYAIVPQYGNTSATGGSLFSPDVTLYFLSEFKCKSTQVLPLCLHKVERPLYSYEYIGLTDYLPCSVGCYGECSNAGGPGSQRAALPGHLVQRVARVIPECDERHSLCGLVGAHECHDEHVH